MVQKPTFGYLLTGLLVPFFKAQVPGDFIFVVAFPVWHKMKAFHELETDFGKLNFSYLN